MKDTENMVEQRTADVRTVGLSLRQKEILGIVLDVIPSLRSSAHALNLNAFSAPLINLVFCLPFHDALPALVNLYEINWTNDATVEHQYVSLEPRYRMTTESILQKISLHSLLHEHLL